MIAAQSQSFSTIVINLDRDVSRLQHMYQSLSRAGIEFARQAGINGTELPGMLKPYFCDAQGCLVSPLSKGEIGCYASHLSVHQRLAAGELGESVLILEDDLDIAPDLIDLLAAALDAMPSRWNILRLSQPPERVKLGQPPTFSKLPKRACVSLSELGAGRSLVRYSKIPNYAGAYLLNRAGAKKFLIPRIRDHALDHDLRRPWIYGLDTYGIVPAPVLQNIIGPSAIEWTGRHRRGLVDRTALTDHAQAFSRFRYNWRVLGGLNWCKCSMRNIVRKCVRALRIRLI